MSRIIDYLTQNITKITTRLVLKVHFLYLWTTDNLSLITETLCFQREKYSLVHFIKPPVTIYNIFAFLNTCPFCFSLPSVKVTWNRMRYTNEWPRFVFSIIWAYSHSEWIIKLFREKLIQYHWHISRMFLRPHIQHTKHTSGKILILTWQKTDLDEKWTI